MIYVKNGESYVIDDTGSGIRIVAKKYLEKVPSHSITPHLSEKNYQKVSQNNKLKNIKVEKDA